MRLMIGTEGKPSLLVSVEDFANENEFDFYVVNGAWPGKFLYGHIIVNDPCGPWGDLSKSEILCQNQDRLHGHYQDVFNNFNDVNYVAPKSKPIPSNWDDDIPF